MNADIEATRFKGEAESLRAERKTRIARAFRFNIFYLKEG